MTAHSASKCLQGRLVGAGVAGRLAELDCAAVGDELAALDALGALAAAELVGLGSAEPLEAAAAL